MGINNYLDSQEKRRQELILTIQALMTHIPPPPHPPALLATRHLSGEGAEGCLESLLARIHAPLFYTPPLSHFSGGGWGCIKSGDV